MSHTLSSLLSVRTALGLAAVVAALAAGAFVLLRAEANLDLSVTPADLTVYGDNAGEQAGEAVAAGDINGDTLEDLIIGAAGLGGRGKTYVIYGNGSLPATVDLDTTNADVTIISAAVSDLLGSAVATGDVNGDTTDDLIIGARDAEPQMRFKAGEVLVFYGGGSLAATIDLSTASADVTIQGANAIDRLGGAVAAGDIDGDTTADLILGASGASPGGRTIAGITYVIYGGANLPTTIDLDSTSADLAVLGDDPGDRSGRAVASGDVNGDTTADLIIGANEAFGSAPHAGETYVLYGGPGLPAIIDLDSTSPDVILRGTDRDDWSGRAVAVGDINGDGTGDVVIGATGGDGPRVCDVAVPDHRCDAGDTYVVYGSASLPATIDLAPDADLTIFGEVPYDMTGDKVAVGDADGDTIDDLLINSFKPFFSFRKASAYLIYGGSGLPATIDLLTTNAGVTITSADPIDKLGSGLALGDLDGDTHDDLILGAYLGDGSGTGTNCGFPDGQVGDRCTAGEVYVVLGGPQPTPTPTPAKQPDPGDTDQDGCSDQAENGPDEGFGGLRNYVYFWDFYDVWTHPAGDPNGWERNRVINIFDVIAVAMRFGVGPLLSKSDALAQALVPPTDVRSYHPAYDRGPIVGPNNWDRAPPDGAINMVNDILGVAVQFGHNCS